MSEASSNESRSRRMAKKFVSFLRNAKDSPKYLKDAAMSTYIENIDPQQLAYGVVRIPGNIIEEHLANALEEQFEKFRHHVGRKYFTAENFATDALAQKVLKSQRVVAAYGTRKQAHWDKLNNWDYNFTPIWEKRNQMRANGATREELDNSSTISESLANKFGSGGGNRGRSRKLVSQQQLQNKKKDGLNMMLAMAGEIVGDTNKKLKEHLVNSKD